MAVAGGREAHVGVSGLLLGGGMFPPAAKYSKSNDWRWIGLITDIVLNP